MPVPSVEEVDRRLLILSQILSAPSKCAEPSTQAQNILNEETRFGTPFNIPFDNQQVAELKRKYRQIYFRQYRAIEETIGPGKLNGLPYTKIRADWNSDWQAVQNEAEISQSDQLVKLETLFKEFQDHLHIWFDKFLERRVEDFFLAKGQKNQEARAILAGEDASSNPAGTGEDEETFYGLRSKAIREKPPGASRNATTWNVIRRRLVVSYHDQNSRTKRKNVLCMREIGGATGSAAGPVKGKVEDENPEKGQPSSSFSPFILAQYFGGVLRVKTNSEMVFEAVLGSQGQPEGNERRSRVKAGSSSNGKARRKRPAAIDISGETREGLNNEPADRRLRHKVAYPSPAETEHADSDTITEMRGGDTPVPPTIRPRGRPKGSKNKPRCRSSSRRKVNEKDPCFTTPRLHLPRPPINDYPYSRTKVCRLARPQNSSGWEVYKKVSMPALTAREI